MATEAPVRRSSRGRSTAPRLSDEQLQEMMALLRGADSTELKVTIPYENQFATVRGLPLDPVESQPRQVYFFDTPDLALNKAGIIVRARRIQGGKGDTVVKLRPVVPNELPADLRADPSFVVEVDALPGGYMCSASFKGKTTGADIWGVIKDGRPLRKLLSKPQRAFFRQRVPEGIDLDGLAVLGPIFLLKGRFEAEMGDRLHPVIRPMVVELWFYPDGSRILELSTKCTPADAFTVAVEARTYLKSRGVDLTGVQQMKTKTALEYYAAQMKPRARARTRRAG